MLKKLFKILSVFAVFALMFMFIVISIEGSSQPEKQKFIRFGGSNPGGSWFTIVGGLSSFLSTKLEGINVTAISTGGSVDNNRIARKGELDMWLTHSLTAFDNWTGTGLFDGEGTFKDYRLLCSVYENHHHFVTLASSNIKSFEDLRGHKVAMGSAGSGGAVNSENILKAIGISEDIEPVYLTWNESARALMDGKVVAMGASSAPLPAVVTIDAQKPIRLLELTDEQFEKIIKQYPAYSRGVIKAGTYSSVKEPSNCISFLVYWAANKNVDSEMVYKVLQVAFDPENATQLGNIHVHLKSLAPKLEAMSSMGIPLHSGAVKFWQEKGLTIPDNLIPAEMK